MNKEFYTPPQLVLIQLETGSALIQTSGTTDWHDGTIDDENFIGSY